MVVLAATSIIIAAPQQGLEEIQQLIQRGDLPAAKDKLDQALKQFPHEASLYNLLGVVDAQEGNYEASEANFKQAIAYSPKSASIYSNLAHLYQMNLNKDPKALGRALAAYRSLLEFDPGNVEAIYQCAILEFRQHSFKASLADLSKLPAADRNKPNLLAILCADQVALGEDSEAEATADRVLSSPALTEPDVLQVLPTLQTERNGDIAVRLLEGLINRQLASAKTFQYLGSIYERRGQLDRAREALEQAFAGQPNSVELLLALAHIAYLQPDYQGALGYLAHARDLDPQNAGIHFFFGMVCVQDDLAHEAYESLKKAVALKPDNPYYNYALGAVAVQRDNVRESVPYFQKYCELKPQDPRGKLALGVAYYYSHDVELARKEFELAAHFRETKAGSLYFLGRLANLEGRPEEARLQLQHCLEVNPKYADAYTELGILNMKQKQYAEAEEALSHAIEFDAQNYRANLNLMVLYQRTNDPRAKDQAGRFEKLRSERDERTKDFLRTIEIRP